MTNLVSRKTSAFGGSVIVPGDKSISIRALILAAMAAGQSRILGLPKSEDVAATQKALSALGADFKKEGDALLVKGVGKTGFWQPGKDLDLGNSGTGSRLLMGVLAGQDLEVLITGDASLKKRPFGRVTEPLSQMGAAFSGEALPLTIKGRADLKPITYRLPVPSAQVKSAVLLAGLSAKGKTRVIEDTPTRNHTECLFKTAGVHFTTEKKGRAKTILITGPQTPKPFNLKIPGDISGAAFLIAAAMITKSPGLSLEGVGVNPTRAAILDVFPRMGAGLSVSNHQNDSGEAMADILVKAGSIKGITTKAEDAPFLIDEFPILFATASFANAPCAFHGLSELRHKESDRLKAMAEGLVANGVKAEIKGDSLYITPGPVRGGATIAACHDHRIAMSFLVMGLASENPIRVTGAETISTSFPGFVKVMNRLGAKIKDLG